MIISTTVWHKGLNDLPKDGERVLIETRRGKRYVAYYHEGWKSPFYCYRVGSWKENQVVRWTRKWSEEDENVRVSED